MTKGLVWILALILGALVGLEFLIGRSHHPVFPWHQIIGSHGAIGLAACVAMVVVCKSLAALGLQVPEKDEDES